MNMILLDTYTDFVGVNLTKLLIKTMIGATLKLHIHS